MIIDVQSPQSPSMRPHSVSGHPSIYMEERPITQLHIPKRPSKSLSVYIPKPVPMDTYITNTQLQAAIPSSPSNNVNVPNCAIIEEDHYATIDLRDLM